MGKALADGYREKVKLATKLPPFQVKTREDMDKLLDVQLQNLKTDHIDYYLLHGLTVNEWGRLKDLGVADFVRKAKADGRIRHIGFSSHNGTADFKADRRRLRAGTSARSSTTSWTRPTRPAKKG